MRRTLRRPAWAVFILALSGWMTACHTYTPVADPMPGSIVRVHIPVRTALDNPNAPTRTQSIEGQLIEAGDTLVLATQSRREFGAFREIIQFDTLRLAPEQRAGVELREFSTGKSVALGVGLTGIVVFAAMAAFGLGGGQQGDGLPPDNPTPAIVSSSMISTIVGFVLGR
ncbi:MAG: hypothetical protein HKN72_15465 [Gemmatimonadetes bacterium]|nr:hypothetical protein [Gemmatimonadota bacterium]